MPGEMQQAQKAQDTYLTAIQVAEVLNVSEGWVRDHTNRYAPFLPHVKLGDLVRYSRKEIDAWVKEQAEQTRLRRAK